MTDSINAHLSAHIREPTPSSVAAPLRRDRCCPGIGAAGLPTPSHEYVQTFVVEPRVIVSFTMRLDCERTTVLLTDDGVVPRPTTVELDEIKTLKRKVEDLE